jgi:hypothetical protein
VSELMGEKVIQMIALVADAQLKSASMPQRRPKVLISPTPVTDSSASLAVVTALCEFNSSGVCYSTHHRPARQASVCDKV